MTHADVEATSNLGAGLLDFSGGSQLHLQVLVSPVEVSFIFFQSIQATRANYQPKEVLSQFLGILGRSVHPAEVQVTWTEAT